MNEPQIKVLVTGCNGQLGQSLQREFAGDGNIEATYTDYDTLDITDREAVGHYLNANKFDVIVNCAAYTAVDRAETDDLKASALNSGAVGNIGEAASKCGTRVIHISTDYVFSGQGFRPYEENDEPYPAGIYGRTKLEGEGLLSSFCQDAMIIRTAWLYSEFGRNFCKTMLQLTATRPRLSVVFDQTGTPTYALDLARAIQHILADYEPSATATSYSHSGIYHYSNEGVCSWYDFTQLIAHLSGHHSCDIQPCHSDEYPSPVKRPAYSVLDKTKIKDTFGIRIPYWTESLRICLENIKQTS